MKLLVAACAVVGAIVLGSAALLTVWGTVIYVHVRWRHWWHGDESDTWLL